MKTTLLILLSSAALCAAQTNRITFTKKSGEIVSGEVTRIVPDGIIYKTERGGGKVLFRDLPPETQKQFGYDAQKAAKFASQQMVAKQKAQQQYAQAGAQLVKSQASAADLKKRADAFFAGRVGIEGTVFQKSQTRNTVTIQEEFPPIPGLFFTDVRDAEISSLSKDQPVRFYGYEEKMTTITNISGFPVERKSVTIKIPDEFKNDPRAKEAPTPRVK